MLAASGEARKRFWGLPASRLVSRRPLCPAVVRSTFSKNSGILRSTVKIRQKCPEVFPGISIQAPLHGMQPPLARGELVEILPDYRPPALPVTLLYGNRRHLAKRVRLFMNWLAEVLQPRLYATPR